MAKYDLATTIERVKKLTFEQATATTIQLFMDLIDPESTFVVEEEERRHVAKLGARRYYAWLEGNFEVAARCQIEGEDYLNEKILEHADADDDTPRH